MQPRRHFSLLLTFTIFKLILFQRCISASQLPDQSPDNKQGLLIRGLLSDFDLEPMPSETSETSESANTTTTEPSKNSTKPDTFRHKLLPIKIKILNETFESTFPALFQDHKDQGPDFYLHDPLLQFDAPFLVDWDFFGCTVKYQLYARYHYRPETEIESGSGNYTKFHQITPVQVEISGRKCDLANLVLLNLKHKHNVTHLILRGSAVRALERFYFGDARLYELRRIDLIANPNLGSIAERAFDGLNQLESLRVFQNPELGIWHRHALVGAKGVRQFIWSRNAPIQSELLLNLTRSAARHVVPALRYLHLESTQSDLTSNKLTKDDLIQLRHLRTLNLISCSLHFVHPMTFALLPQLEQLNLAQNPLPLENLVQMFTTLSRLSKSIKLASLDLSGIRSLTTTSGELPKLLLLPLGKIQITQLYLRSISLKSISSSDLPPMPHLEQLYLDHNPLALIEDHALDPLENLRLLSMRGHALAVIRSEMFYNLPKLRHLDLSGDPGSGQLEPLEIEPKTFVGLNPAVLDLSHRYLDPLPSKTFLGLHKTERLYLRNCGLTQIEYLTFFFVKSLKLLDLSDNPGLIESLRETHDDSFFGLESVEQIRMAGCNLTSPDLDPSEGIFTRMHELVRELDLSRNQIQNLTLDQFGQFPELQSLNLSYNQIEPWMNESVFGKNTELAQLDLSHNQIQALTSSMMDDMYRIQNLSFGDNPLVCDCSLQLFNSDWLEQSAQQLSWIDSANPMYSQAKYYCLDNPIGNSTHRNLAKFTEHCATHLEATKLRQSHLVASYLIVAIVLIGSLISLGVLAVTFVYYSELNQLIEQYFRKSPDLGHDDRKYEYDAFVSYNVADSDWIFNHLVPNIELNDRTKLCVYDRDFIAGRPISECILESIRQSRRVILVVSNAFISSPWCRYETDLAHHHNTLLNRTGGVDGLVLVKLDQISPDLAIPIQLDFLLKTRIYLEWDSAAEAGIQTEFWTKLKAALGLTKNPESALKEDPKPKLNRLKLMRRKLHSFLRHDILAKLPKLIPHKPEVATKEIQNIPQIGPKCKRKTALKQVIAGFEEAQLEVKKKGKKKKVECLKYCTAAYDTESGPRPKEPEQEKSEPTLSSIEAEKQYCDSTATTATVSDDDDDDDYIEINVRL